MISLAISSLISLHFCSRFIFFVLLRSSLIRSRAILITPLHETLLDYLEDEKIFRWPPTMLCLHYTEFTEFTALPCTRQWSTASALCVNVKSWNFVEYGDEIEMCMSVGAADDELVSVFSGPTICAMRLIYGFIVCDRFRLAHWTLGVIHTVRL